MIKIVIEKEHKGTVAEIFASRREQHRRTVPLCWDALVCISYSIGGAEGVEFTVGAIKTLLSTYNALLP